MTDDDLFTMAKTIWGESRGEPRLGKIAVAWVIRNRFESGKWFAGPTISETCTKPWQFSAWNDNDPNRARLEVVTLGDPVFIECVYVAAGVMCGALPDPTHGSTHYYAPGSTPSMPKWAVGKDPCYTSGRHKFFKGID